MVLNFYPNRYCYTFVAMLQIDPKAVSTPELHGYLLASVAPRPICFASTIDASGKVNLSPYSFFNVFSANPPISVFSPARRVRDNTVKHTLENVQETSEVVVNIVNYAMVQQMSLSSTEYPKGVNEFVKAGFTEVPSLMVKPPRVKEAPVQMECKVNEVVALGTEGGAGHLVICEVVQLHIDESILDSNGKIDSRKLDPVARMGGNWYSRAIDGMFEVEKPLRTMGVGVDALPKEIRESSVLTGNDLGRLANIEQLPNGIVAKDEATHKKAHALLEEDRVAEAWSILVN